VDGKLVISLDFELKWGVLQKGIDAAYNDNVKGVWTVLPQMLELFRKYNCRVTWSTVGFLFYENAQQLLSDLPEVQPQYSNPVYSPYVFIAENYDHLKNDKLYFAPALIQKIKNTEGQVIGTHTYSHYYCLEEGQSAEEFEADIQSANKVAGRYGIQNQSIIFPRNQLNEEYIDILVRNGIKAIRSNPDNYLYRAGKNESKSPVGRIGRLLDTYFNITGHHTTKEKDIYKHNFIDIPGSRFLRPYEPKLSFMEKMKVRRIKKSMLYAARKGEIYHLWWHPHNFGKHIDESLAILESILEYYMYLNKKYNYKSCAMEDFIIQESDSPQENRNKSFAGNY
jgi:peptidoglycan/xylan/chitin deacetylase (PgdA/CDA1 family)